MTQPAQRKIILFELNEVPLRIIQYYVKGYPNSTFAKIWNQSTKYETYSEDVGHLSPWITWPSLHRGVANNKHFISDFGEDLTEQNKAFPNLWEILAKHKVSLGIFSSLHTYPPPTSFENYSFYVPDMFALGRECFPDNLQPFQNFNIAMSRESGLNVKGSIVWKDALRFMASMPSLGIRPQTVFQTIGQMVDEQQDKWKVVRRRTYQSVFAFDVFYKQLKKHQPSFTSFFTNHVASSMHRYWAAAFPEDYSEINLPRAWFETYAKEIEFTMRKADDMLARLISFTQQNPEYDLWIASSMGQEATLANERSTMLLITDVSRFMQYLGIPDTAWVKNTSMIPQFNFTINEAFISQFESQLQQIRIQGKPISYRNKGHGFFSIDVGHPDIVQLEITHNHLPINPLEMGFSNVEIQDKSGSTAYHIPQGSLLIYSPVKQPGSAIQQISTLDIAPSLLANYGIGAMDYMNKASVL
jgi:hypothetical protein